MTHRNARRPRPSTAGYRRNAIGLAVASLFLAGATLPAQAQSADTPAATTASVRDYNIPAGPLSPALSRFAGLAGVTLSTDAALTEGLSTQGMRGRYGITDGFAQLLKGSGLSAVALGGGIYRLERLPARTGEATLAPMTVTASGLNDGTTEGTASYAPSAVSIGKGKQALKDVPQSVTVISRQRMDDQALRSIDDVMTQAAGVSMTTNGYYGSTYTARGLGVNKVRYDGGVARKQNIGWYQRNGDDDMAVFDHVEVLRGADGLFAGAGEAGGMLNLSYKRPTPVFQAHGELSLGSWKNRRVEADISGPLALDGRVRGRLVAAQQDRDYFYDHGSRRTSVLYGALETDLTPDTRLFAGIDHQSADERGTSWGHQRYLNGSLVTANRRTSYTAPWSWADSERTISFMQLEHQWNADWKTQLRLEHYDAPTDFHTARLGGPIYPETLGSYWGSSWDGDIKHLSADLLLKGSFDWLGRRHDVMLGMDWARSKAHYLFSELDFGAHTWSRLNPIVVPPRPTEKHPGGPNETVDHQGTEHGVYGSFHLRPFEDWTLIAGGRYVVKDKYDARSIWLGDLSRTVTDQGSVFIPYYGAVYALNERTNAYASTTQIYTSQATRLGGPPPGTPLDPVRGSNHELGIKHELDNRLMVSAALYGIEKKGMAVRDSAYPSTPGELGSSCCYYRDGYQISEGLDLELNGELLPGWEVSVGYTYNKNENKRANDARFSTVTPRHLLKLWTQYSFSGAWRGLRLGAGVVAQSSSSKAGQDWPRNPVTGNWESAVPYRISQAGYAVWSARAKYELSPNASVSVNVNNLFDKRYFSSLGSLTNGNYYGEPRHMMVRLHLKY